MALRTGCNARSMKAGVMRSSSACDDIKRGNVGKRFLPCVRLSSSLPHPFTHQSTPSDISTSRIVRFHARTKKMTAADGGVTLSNFITALLPSRNISSTRASNALLSLFIGGWQILCRLDR